MHLASLCPHSYPCCTSTAPPPHFSAPLPSVTPEPLCPPFHYAPRNPSLPHSLLPVPRAPAPSPPCPSPTPTPVITSPSPSPARPHAVPEPGSSLHPGPRTRYSGFSGPEEQAEVPSGPGFPSRVPAAAGPRLGGAPGRRRRGRGRGGRGGARGGGVPGKGRRPETRAPQGRFRHPTARRSDGPLFLSI